MDRPFLCKKADRGKEMGMSQNTLISQIVGYKNAGKTTVMVKLIEYLSKNQIKIGTIKHHGHGGNPTHVSGTDSHSLMLAGAKVSTVQGESLLQLNAEASFSLEEIIALYRSFSFDLLLVEGYKQAHYPKIVLIRNEEDLQLLSTLSNIVAVGLHANVVCQEHDYYTFALSELDDHIPILAELCLRKR
ncbi:molybdopterin-guanine dinucleotide biosynthesis protein B [Virgibacillus sp. MG-45]|uniref:molybdopterin-guanine dinucleotide biosynthesis protein B n=1 Tax=Virgibacillus sp. MG-45 TaxID=3102791 RepID=UPI002ED7D8FD